VPGPYISTPPFALVLEPFAMNDPETAALSEREREVICLLSCGLSTREAAARLGIERKTADTHRGRAVKKIGARNNEDLVRWCLTWGFIHLDGTIS
jgi:DNA-binding CsgD family transcriptional regulator